MPLSVSRCGYRQGTVPRVAACDGAATWRVIVVWRFRACVLRRAPFVVVLLCLCTSRMKGYPMDDEEKDAEATETPAEAEEAADTGATPEEAHREGEFDSIIAKLDAIQAALASLIVDSAGAAPAPSEPVPTPDLADLDSWDW